MKAIITGAVMALATTAAGAAEADYANANYVLPGCKVILEKTTPNGMSGVTVQQIFDGGVCEGMFSVLLSIGWSRMNGETLCMNIPRNATREQLIRVAVRYIEARPQRIHEPFVNLAIEALQATWPCTPDGVSMPILPPKD